MAFDAMAGTIVVEKEMAITHADFLRTLPRALDGRGHTVDGNRIVVEDGRRRLEITLSETTGRRIAQLTLPATRVRLEFPATPRPRPPPPWPCSTAPSGAAGARSWTH